MPKRRLELHALLCSLENNQNVYYQPPADLVMRYPAIKYEFVNVSLKHADDKKYASFDRYQITVITKQIDPSINEKLSSLQYCSFDRHYIADNLHHYVFTIYF